MAILPYNDLMVRSDGPSLSKFDEPLLVKTIERSTPPMIMKSFVASAAFSTALLSILPRAFSQQPILRRLYAKLQWLIGGNPASHH
jgi:hypothetical protein